MGRRAVPGASRSRRGGPAGRGCRVGALHWRAGHGHHHRISRHRRRTRSERPSRPLAGPGRRHARRSAGVVPQRGDRRPPEPGSNVLPGPGPTASDDLGHLRKAPAVGPGAAAQTRGGGSAVHRCLPAGRALHPIRRFRAGHGVVVPLQIAVVRPVHPLRLLRRLRPVAAGPGSVGAAHLRPSGVAAGDFPPGARRNGWHQQCPADSRRSARLGGAHSWVGHLGPRRVGTRGKQ